MQWELTLTGTFKVQFQTTGATEDDAYAEGIERLRKFLERTKPHGDGLTISPAYRGGKIRGTPDPDPRD